MPSLLAHHGDLWDFRRHLDNPVAIRCPYGAPGDRLWCKETHAPFMVGGQEGERDVLTVRSPPACGRLFALQRVPR